MTTVAPGDLIETVTGLCRRLRERGVLVTPGETVDAVRTLDAVDVGDRAELYLALRSVVTTRPEDYRAFDEEFDRAFTASGGAAGTTDAHGPQPRLPPPVRRAAGASTALENWLRATGAEPDDPGTGIPRPSDRDLLSAHDFRAFDDAALDAVTRVARRMARRLATRPSRRWRPSTRGARVHLRRTMRRVLETGGAPARLVFRERKPRRTRLVLLCDVSGSMELYTRFLLQVLYAMQNSFARVETFVFATRLSRVTEPLGAPRYRAALEGLARDVRDFAGGTRIGECLDRFEREWGRRLDRRTVVVVLSDGWDTGDPALLGDAMARLHRRAGRVIWLNPLLGAPDYRPLTRGLQAALPHVDIFHPAHDLTSLEALVRHLSL